MFKIGNKAWIYSLVLTLPQRNPRKPLGSLFHWNLSSEYRLRQFEARFPEAQITQLLLSYLSVISHVNYGLVDI